VEAILLRLLLLGILILFSGFFSGSETALFSLGRVQLARLHEQKHVRAVLLERLLGQPRRLIATIFIGNELVMIAASTVVASITDDALGGLGDAWVTVVSTVVSVPLILIFGEVTPKNLAVKLGDRWATAAAVPLAMMQTAFTPVRRVVEAIADATVRLTGRTPPAPSPVGEDEFRTLVEKARADGQIDPAERALITRILEMSNRTAGEVMTPADRLFSLRSDLPLAETVAEVRKNVYSRIPVWEGSADRVVGLVYAKDLLAAARGSETRTVREILRVPLYVPRSTRCDALLREFQRRRTHVALVVDEYGKLSGLVSLEDLLEEVFGEIVDEKERRRRTVAGSVRAPVRT
jgi:putative hemolysin